MEFTELTQWTLGPETMTFPAYRPLLACLSLDPSILCILAKQGEAAAGMGLLKITRDRAELLSLFVKPEFRSRNIGKALALQMENHPKLKTCKTIFTRYNSHVPGRLPLEKILSGSGWSHPVAAMYLYRSTRELLKKIIHMPECMRYRNPVLARGYSLVKWCDLSPHDLDAIRQNYNKPHGWTTKESPFLETGKIEPLNSFCIFKDNRACGWFINHRIKTDTLRYTLAWLSGRVSGKRGIIVQTFIHCLWRQILHGPEFVSFGIYKDNQAMLQMVEKRMVEQGLIFSRTQTYYTEKRISK